FLGRLHHLEPQLRHGQEPVALWPRVPHHDELAPVDGAAPARLADRPGGALARRDRKPRVASLRARAPRSPSGGVLPGLVASGGLLAEELRLCPGPANPA